MASIPRPPLVVLHGDGARGLEDPVPRPAREILRHARDDLLERAGELERAVAAGDPEAQSWLAAFRRIAACIGRSVSPARSR